MCTFPAKQNSLNSVGFVPLTFIMKSVFQRLVSSYLFTLFCNILSRNQITCNAFSLPPKILKNYFTNILLYSTFIIVQRKQVAN